LAGGALARGRGVSLQLQQGAQDGHVHVRGCGGYPVERGGAVQRGLFIFTCR
jgi:hypothetical protein